MSFQRLKLFTSQTDINIKKLYATKNSKGFYNEGKIFSSPEDLQEYIQTNLEAFEYVSPDTDLIKVFWDIDVKDSDVTKEEKESLETKLEQIISFLAKALVTVLAIQNCMYLKKENGDFVMLMERQDFKDAIKNIIEEATCTKSTDPTKISYHIIFPNLLVSPETWLMVIPHLKKYFSEVNDFRKNTPSTLLKKLVIAYVDFVVWKREPTLRCPYSMKCQGDPYKHEIVRGTFSDALITWIPVSENKYFISLPESNISDGGFEDANGFMNLKETRTINKEIVKVLNEIFGDQIELTTKDFTDGERYSLSVNYATKCCPLCNAEHHRNDHYFIKRGKILSICKYGNAKNCKFKKINLKITENEYLRIAMMLYEKGDIKKYQEDHFIVWNGNNWCFDKASYVFTSYILKVSKTMDSNIRLLLQDFHIRKTVERNLIDLLGAEPPVEVDAHPHIMYFNNGSYNMITDEFYMGEDSKKFIGNRTTGYDFNPNWQDNRAIVNAVADLTTVLNQIQVDTPENKENKDLYEIILGSCLYGFHKEYITFFHGGTMGGKSTSKKIVGAALGNFMVETNSSILTENMDVKGPNPFLAQANYKRALFASELDKTMDNKYKIRAVNVKKITDHKIIGRLCNSNVIEQQNYATIIVDTNHEPFFDTVDNAIVRRCLMIKFKSVFVDNKNSILIGNRKNVFPLRPELSGKLNILPYKIASFIVLKNLFQKHFVTPDGEINMPFKTTPELFMDFTFVRKLPDYILESSSETLDDIDPKYCGEYSIINNKLCIGEEFLKNYLFSKFPAKLFGNEIQTMLNSHVLTDLNDESWVNFIIKKHLLIK